MSEILIIARTRMNNGNVCIGAIEMATGRMLRPLTIDGKHFNEKASFPKGDVWNIEYSARSRTEPPHVEDVHIHRMQKIDTLPNIGQWIRENQSHLNIVHGPAQHLYDGTLTFFPYNLNDTVRLPRSAWLERGGLMPSNSLQLWKTDRLLVKSQTFERGKRETRYTGICPDTNGVSFRMKHVGYREEPIIIPTGSIVSLSLARWWNKPDGQSREACYLQLCDVLDMP